MTLARRLAEHCVTLSIEDLDDETIDYTKKLVLDTFGTAVGGYHWSDTAGTIVDTARSLQDDRLGGRVTVLATGERLHATNAALLNGALSHSLDYDNRHSPGSLHIGSSVITAALAAAEVTGANGRRFLEGVVAGYDVAARLGMACNPRSSHERGFHPTGTCGTFGATAAVAAIEGLSVEELVAAFGLNGSQAGGSYECSTSGGWNKRVHPGLAARNAIVGVEFAKNGFVGPSEPIGGELGFLRAYADRPDPERAISRLGEVFEVTRTKIKPYPLGTFSHAPIALLTELAHQENLEPDAIRRITVEVPTSGAEMFGRSNPDDHPRTSAEAQFDMPFAVALSVTAREAGLGAFNDALSDEYSGSFERLMRVTKTVGSEELEEYLPERYPARVIVETEDETYVRFQDWVKGEPDVPLSWDDLRSKFTDLTPKTAQSTRDRIVDGVRTVETISIDNLVALFRER